jgi:hypothetical protein
VPACPRAPEKRFCRGAPHALSLVTITLTMLHVPAGPSGWRSTQAEEAARDRSNAAVQAEFRLLSSCRPVICSRVWDDALRAAEALGFVSFTAHVSQRERGPDGKNVPQCREFEALVLGGRAAAAAIAAELGKSRASAVGKVPTAALCARSPAGTYRSLCSVKKHYETSVHAPGVKLFAGRAEGIFSTGKKLAAAVERYVAAGHTPVDIGDVMTAKVTLADFLAEVAQRRAAAAGGGGDTAVDAPALAVTAEAAPRPDEPAADINLVFASPIPRAPSALSCACNIS